MSKREIHKILIPRMKNAGFNIGEQAVILSILKDLSTINGSEIEVMEGTTKSMEQKIGLKDSHSYLPLTWDTFRSISKADVLVWGGGHMLQDETSALDIPYHLINVFLARALRIPVILYGVEIGPIDTKIGAFFATRALKNVNLILVRNNRSASVLRRIGIDNPNIHVTADPAFLVTPDEQIMHQVESRYGIKNNRPLVGIAPRKAFYKVSGLLPATIRQKLNLMPRDFDSKFSMLKRKIALICDYLVNRFDAQILFLPMDVAENPRDDLTCKAIFDLMEKKQDAFLLDPGLNPSEISGLIKAMDLVISQRLHALILSCSMSTPMIGIPSTGKHDKCTMFMKDIGQEDRCFTASSLIDENQNDALFAALNETWKSRQEIREEIALKAREFKMKSSMNIDYVFRWLHNYT